VGSWRGRDLSVLGSLSRPQSTTAPTAAGPDTRFGGAIITDDPDGVRDAICSDLQGEVTRIEDLCGFDDWPRPVLHVVVAAAIRSSAAPAVREGSAQLR
jgi:hypothetical protein